MDNYDLINFYVRCLPMGHGYQSALLFVPQHFFPQHFYSFTKCTLFCTQALPQAVFQKRENKNKILGHTRQESGNLWLCGDFAPLGSTSKNKKNNRCTNILGQDRSNISGIWAETESFCTHCSRSCLASMSKHHESDQMKGSDVCQKSRNFRI